MMNILLTGKKGAGKTTLCMNVIEKLKNHFNIGGVICPDAYENRERVGSDAIDLLTGEKRVMMRPRKIADFEGIDVGVECKVSGEGLEHSKKALDNAIKEEDCNLIVIDHIGLLERDGGGIIESALNALSSGKNTITIIRSNVREGFLKKYPELRFQTYQVNKINNEIIQKEIIDLLKKDAS